MTSGLLPLILVRMALKSVALLLLASRVTTFTPAALTVFSNSSANLFSDAFNQIPKDYKNNILLQKFGFYTKQLIVNLLNIIGNKAFPSPANPAIAF